MVRPESTREKIGNMLVASGLISRAQLSEALSAQRSSELPLGKQLVALGYVREAQLIQVLSNQLSVPWVSLDRVEFSADLLARLPSELADRYCAMPIYIRMVRGRGETLYIAMDDPTDEEALACIARATGLKVRAMIASPSELRNAIEERYFGATPSPQPELKSPGFGDERTGRTAKLPMDDPRSGKVRPPPPPKTAPRADGAVPVEQYATPSRPPPDNARTLTLLDGTRIQLPSARKAAASQSVTAVRHAVKAVSSATSEIGPNGPLRWHDIVQALIDAAAARGVTLSRKELADAWLRAKQEPERRSKQG